MAVYTKISQIELDRLVENYNIGKVESFIAVEAGIQNSTYFVDTARARYVLTIFEKTLNYKELPFFLKLMEHFAKKNLPCPAVIPDKNGNLLSEVKGKPCAIISFLRGGELKIIEEGHLAELGSSVAFMHQSVSDFSLNRVNDISINGWVNIFNSVRSRINEFQPGLEEELSINLDYLLKNWPENLPSGVIHGDLFPDNVFFEGSKLVGIIDFYFSCTDAFMYDLAICLNSWCFEKHDDFNSKKAKMLLSSYSSVRKISPKELEALPVLAFGAAMRFFLSRLRDWLERVDGAFVTTKDPMEYLYKMRFHSKIKSYNEYLIG